MKKFIHAMLFDGRGQHRTALDSGFQRKVNADELSGDAVIKFSSPMCYECQELEKVFEEVFPKYDKDIKIQKIDVTKKGKNCDLLIKEYLFFNQ